MPILYTPDLDAWGSARGGLGLPGLLNASVAVYALHPVELEVGVEGSLGHSGFTARAGVALTALERRNSEGRGVSLFVPLLGGYRFMDLARPEPAHALTLNPTLTADFWVARHFGFEVSFTGGLSLVVSDPSGAAGGPLGPDVALRTGIVF